MMSDNTLNPLKLNLDENDLSTIDTLSDEMYSALGLSPSYFNTDANRRCPYCGYPKPPNAAMCGVCPFSQINDEINRR